MRQPPKKSIKQIQTIETLTPSQIEEARDVLVDDILSELDASSPLAKRLMHGFYESMQALERETGEEIVPLGNYCGIEFIDAEEPAEEA